MSQMTIFLDNGVSGSCDFSHNPTTTSALTCWFSPLTLPPKAQITTRRQQMLPAHRTEGEGFSIPQFDLTPRDVDGFLGELQAFHGQFSALERKSIEPMARHVDGGNVRGMQRCMSDDVWDEDTMRVTYHDLVANEMGEPDGVLIIDESGFVKKGQDSVGVARQYCGTLGKVENSQVGVFAAYASRHGYALVDK